MNAQKGILPHGWLEYTDESSNRPYYYNVHTKVRPAARANTRLAGPWAVAPPESALARCAAGDHVV